MDYQNGKIYTIRTHKSDEFYIGSTTQPLTKRLSKHKSNYKGWKIGKYCYVSSFKIIENGDAYIELLEECPCENKMLLQKREGELIRANNCVNKRIEGRTKKEYREDNKDKIKEYYGKNKDKLKQKREDNKYKIKEYHKKYREENKDKIKEYYENNKDKISEKRKEYYEINKDKKKEYQKKKGEEIIECECGSNIRTDSISKHKKSMKHKQFQSIYDFIYE